MKKIWITVLLFSQILLLLAQEHKENCINLTDLKGKNLFLHTTTSRLIEFVGKPDYFTLDREHEFPIFGPTQNPSSYKIVTNTLMYQHFAYWEKEGSVWIKQIYFDNKLNYTILYRDIIFNQNLHIDDFLKYFDVKEEDITLLDKQKNFTENKVYYTRIGLSVCESQYSEFVAFYFDKKGFLESIVFYVVEF